MDTIDHLALALPAGRIDTYILFWRSLFGLEPQLVWDLLDPYGLVQSRAMVNAAGTLRLDHFQADCTGQTCSSSLFDRMIHML